MKKNLQTTDIKVTVGIRSIIICNQKGPDFDDKSSFFPCKVDDAIQYINLGYGEHAPKIVN